MTEAAGRRALSEVGCWLSDSKNGGVGEPALHEEQAEKEPWLWLYCSGQLVVS